ncbi:hypothetical protein WA026_000108 [Henosepilachna vigintioctopunctata]|uniref:Uncharacterized protein n=1 Tax=Henosepilachna vigintioctopunctata TaxID=420089 RepID=A0AAW1UXD3_9CUCU
MKEAVILGYHRCLLGLEYHEEFNKMEDLKIFEEQCNEKLIEFKRVKIANSNVSVYDVLTSSTHKLAKYLTNEEILMSLKNYDTLDCGFSKNVSYNVWKKVLKEWKL